MSASQRVAGGPANATSWRALQHALMITVAYALIPSRRLTSACERSGHSSSPLSNGQHHQRDDDEGEPRMLTRSLASSSMGFKSRQVSSRAP